MPGVTGPTANGEVELEEGGAGEREGKDQADQR